MSDTLQTLIPVGVGLITILVLMFSNQKEGFASIIGSQDSMPRNLSPAGSGLPLFLNFYPKNTGQDFNLFDLVQKLKLSNQTAPRGPFNTNGVGQFNRKLFKTKKLCPVIIVPGLGATPIYATWNKDSVESVKSVDESGNFERQDAWSCKQVQDTFVKLWYPDTEKSLSNYCWADNIKVMPTEDGGMANSTGVRTSTDSFGSLKFGSAYDNLTEALGAMGYTEGENLFGAGYDFRKISDPKELDAWCLSLTNLIERTCSLQGYPAMIIGHDLGSMVANYFLSNAVPEWKRNYIKCFVSVNGAFGGSPKALRAMLSGPEVPLADSQISNNFTGAVRNFSGLSMMLPCPEVYGDNPLVHLNNVTYTSYDIPKLIENVSLEAATVYKNSEPIRKACMKAPEVPVFIVCGDGLNTESSYKYKMSLTSNPQKNYPVYQLELPASQKFSYPDYYTGDGTMPRFALEYPIFWSKHQQEMVSYKFFANAEHSKILSMEGPIRHIIGLLKD